MRERSGIPVIISMAIRNLTQQYRLLGNLETSSNVREADMAYTNRQQRVKEAENLLEAVLSGYNFLKVGERENGK